MSETKDLCPCGSGKKYSECCEPIIKGATKAPSAEACMRARYSSYVKHEIDYILNSCEEGEGIAEVDRQATEDWSKQSQWNGLKILRTEKGEKEDEAIVEFEADYTLHNMHDIHHEISLFKKIIQIILCKYTTVVMRLKRNKVKGNAYFSPYIIYVGLKK